MSVREYIGARYVPLFADPLEWDATKTYEPLTVVLYQGNSYTSRQAVPANIPISNTTYWAQTGNYNAQVEQYRAEVETFDNRITQNTNDISAVESIIPAEDFSDSNTVKDYIDNAVQNVNANVDNLSALLPDEEFTENNTVKDYVDNAIQDVEVDVQDVAADVAGLGALLPSNEFTTVNTVKKYIDDSVVESTKLSDKKAIIYGDSTMIESTDGNSVLGTLIAEVTGMEITNRAVSGTNLTHLINYLNSATAGDFTGYDFVFIAYGTNDWHNGKQLWDTFGTDSNDTFQKQLNIAFDRLDAIRGTCKPIIVTPAYARRNDYSYNLDNVPTSVNSQGLKIESYVDVELLEARKRDYPAIDLYHTMGVSDNNYQQLMMRSSYDPNSEHYNKWFHYSETLKQRIAQVFLHDYPYNVPAYPFDTSAENNLYYDYGRAVPITEQFGYIPLVTGFGNVDNTNIPHFTGKFTGDDTLSFVAKTSGYCDIQIGTSDVVRIPCRHSGYKNIRIKGIYGEKNVYIYSGESTPASKGDPVYNVCLQHGNTAFPYTLPARETTTKWANLVTSGMTSDTVAKACLNNGIAYVVVSGKSSSTINSGAQIIPSLPSYFTDLVVPYKYFPFYYALSSGGGWQQGMAYIGQGGSGPYLALNTAITAANSNIEIMVSIPRTYA